MSDNREERWQDLDLAAQNVTRAGTLVGSTIAVFSFLLFFLYPHYSLGQIDAILFQVTLTIIVLTNPHFQHLRTLLLSNRRAET